VVAYDPDALDVAMASCSNCLVTTAASSGYFSLKIPVLAGVSLNAFATTHSFVTGYGAFIGGVTAARCPAEPVTLAADYFHIGPILLTLYQGANEWGSGIIYPDESIRVTSRPFGSIYYIGSRASIGLPFQLGPWVTVPMRNSFPGTFVGT